MCLNWSDSTQYLSPEADRYYLVSMIDMNTSITKMINSKLALSMWIDVIRSVWSTWSIQFDAYDRLGTCSLDANQYNRYDSLRIWPTTAQTYPSNLLSRYRTTALTQHLLCTVWASAQLLHRWLKHFGMIVVILRVIAVNATMYFDRNVPNLGRET